MDKTIWLRDNDIQLSSIDIECLKEGEQVTVKGRDKKEYNIEWVE